MKLRRTKMVPVLGHPVIVYLETFRPWAAWVARLTDEQTDRHSCSENATFNYVAWLKAPTAKLQRW